MKIMYGNLKDGKYTIEKKASAWFVNTFLNSFDVGEYYALDCWLRSWQYKGVMETVKNNHWKMLSPKQWDVFRNNLVFNKGTFEDFANFQTDTKTVSIRISSTTGFVTIRIRNK